MVTRPHGAAAAAALPGSVPAPPGSPRRTVLGRPALRSRGRRARSGWRASATASALRTQVGVRQAGDAALLCQPSVPLLALGRNGGQGTALGPGPRPPPDSAPPSARGPQRGRSIKPAPRRRRRGGSACAFSARERRAERGRRRNRRGAWPRPAPRPSGSGRAHAGRGPRRGAGTWPPGLQSSRAGRLPGLRPSFSPRAARAAGPTARARLYGGGAARPQVGGPGAAARGAAEAGQAGRPASQAARAGGAGRGAAGAPWAARCPRPGRTLRRWAGPCSAFTCRPRVLVSGWGGLSGGGPHPSTRTQREWVRREVRGPPWGAERDLQAVPPGGAPADGGLVDPRGAAPVSAGRRLWAAGGGGRCGALRAERPRRSEAGAPFRLQVDVLLGDWGRG